MAERSWLWPASNDRSPPARLPVLPSRPFKMPSTALNTNGADWTSGVEGVELREPSALARFNRPPVTHRPLKLGTRAVVADSRDGPADVSAMTVIVQRQTNCR